MHAVVTTSTYASAPLLLPSHPCGTEKLQKLASSWQRSQEVCKQVTNGDDTLAPSLLVYYDDSLEPKVGELLEHSLQTRYRHRQSKLRKRAGTKRAAVRSAYRSQRVCIIRGIFYSDAQARTRCSVLRTA